MPTYVYRCKKCAYEFEAVQRMTEDPLTTCPECKGEIARVPCPPGIVFKGSGFYVNDYPGAKSAGYSSSSDSASSETKTETKSETKTLEPVAAKS